MGQKTSRASPIRPDTAALGTARFRGRAGRAATACAARVRIVMGLGRSRYRRYVRRAAVSGAGIPSVRCRFGNAEPSGSVVPAAADPDAARADLVAGRTGQIEHPEQAGVFRFLLCHTAGCALPGAVVPGRRPSRGMRSMPCFTAGNTLFDDRARIPRSARVRRVPRRCIPTIPRPRMRRPFRVRYAARANPPGVAPVGSPPTKVGSPATIVIR